MKKWFVQKHTQNKKVTYYIRRYLEDRFRENLKASHVTPELFQIYIQLRDDKNYDELVAFCNDLNSDQIHREECQKIWLSKKRKIQSLDVFDRFFGYLRSQLGEKHAKDIFGAFNLYSKKFFYEDCKLHALHEWKNHNTNFCNYLWQNFPHKVRGVEFNSKLSLKRIKTIISTNNYFYQFLREDLKDERFNFKFTNSKSNFMKKNHEDDRIKSLPSEIVRRSQREWINDNDLNAIELNCPSEIRSAVLLAMKFGVREAESLGFTLGDTRESFLFCHQQLIKYPENNPKYGPLKNRTTRDIPYYLTSPDEAYELIQNLKLMTARTLAKKWSHYLNELFMVQKISKTYEFHSLRNTFITNLIKKMDKKELDIPITDIQLAAGHSSRSQTEAYIRDYRNFNGRKAFVPKKVS